MIYSRRGCLFQTSKISFLYANAFSLFGTTSWSWFVSVFVHERITTVNQAIYEQVEIILEDVLQSSPKRQEDLKKEKFIYSASLTYSLRHCETILLTCQSFPLTVSLPQQIQLCWEWSWLPWKVSFSLLYSFFCSHSSLLPFLGTLNLSTEWVFSLKHDVAFFVFHLGPDSHQSNQLIPIILFKFSTGDFRFLTTLLPF